MRTVLRRKVLFPTEKEDMRFRGVCLEVPAPTSRDQEEASEHETKERTHSHPMD